jgi:hypothetical protein
MAYAVDPEDAAIFRSYLDGVGQPAAARMAMLSEAPGVALPGMDPAALAAATPDHPSRQGTAPPAAPPTATDAGGAPAAAVSPDVYTARALQSWPGAEMPAPQGAAQAPAPQPVAMPGAEGAPAEEYRPAVSPVDQWVLGGAMGGPGRVVEEHEQKQGYQIERQAPIDRAPVMDAYRNEATEAEAAGAMGRLALEDEADAAAKRKMNAAADLADFEMRQRAQQEELEDREKAYSQLVEESKVDPNIWNRKSGGEMMMTAIGGLLMGLGGSADKFIEMIQQDREHAQEERDVSLKESRGRLDDFRSRTMSPQAAAQFEDALKARIVAEDIRIMAAESGSVESQVAGEQAAAQLERQAALWEADAKQREAGAIAEKVAVIPRQVVGGAPGGLPGIIARINKLPISAEAKEEYIKQAARGQLNIAGIENRKLTDAQQKAEDRAIGSIVTLPDGRTAYATNSARATKIQDVVDANNELRENYARQRALLEKGMAPGSDDIVSYNNLASRNEFLLKNKEELGQLTNGDREMSNPFTGAGGADLTAFKSRTMRALNEAEGATLQRDRTFMRQLFADPHAKERIAPPDPDEAMGRPVE